jgi:hypothetical protein
MNLILKAMLCPLPTNADWRAEARKIVVLITDPSPHGIGGDGDEFPEGCPLGKSYFRSSIVMDQPLMPN